MNAITAIWTNGQVVPSEPVDWPEGSRLIIEPIESGSEKLGMDESQWEDTPGALADWEAWIKTIEPMVWAEGEREEYERHREEERKFNIEAVRKQMDEMKKDDAK